MVPDKRKATAVYNTLYVKFLPNARDDIAESSEHRFIS